MIHIHRALLLIASVWAVPASAEVFKSVKECVPGKRVIGPGEKAGVITRVETNGTLCYAKLDNGKEQTGIFWMFRAEGASAETDDKLLVGTYACYASGQYTFMDIRITGANSYATDAGAGRYHVEPSRMIIFESGPLAKHKSKLERGPNININSDGGSFYGTTCSYQKK